MNPLMLMQLLQMFSGGGYGGGSNQGGFGASGGPNGYPPSNPLARFMQMYGRPSGGGPYGGQFGYGQQDGVGGPWGGGGFGPGWSNWGGGYPGGWQNRWRQQPQPPAPAQPAPAAPDDPRLQAAQGGGGTSNQAPAAANQNAGRDQWAQQMRSVPNAYGGQQPPAVPTSPPIRGGRSIGRMGVI